MKDRKTLNIQSITKYSQEKLLKLYYNECSYNLFN